MSVSWTEKLEKFFFLFITHWSFVLHPWEGPSSMFTPSHKLNRGNSQVIFCWELIFKLPTLVMGRKKAVNILACPLPSVPHNGVVLWYLKQKWKLLHREKSYCIFCPVRAAALTSPFCIAVWMEQPIRTHFRRSLPAQPISARIHDVPEFWIRRGESCRRYKALEMDLMFTFAS